MTRGTMKAQRTRGGGQKVVVEPAKRQTALRLPVELLRDLKLLAFDRRSSTVRLISEVMTAWVASQRGVKHDASPPVSDRLRGSASHRASARP